MEGRQRSDQCVCVCVCVRRKGCFVVRILKKARRGVQMETSRAVGCREGTKEGGWDKGKKGYPET